MYSSHASYEFDSLTDHSKVVLRDVGPWDKHPTVTNNAENVVKDLVEAGMLTPGRRLFYYDSEGDFSEILLRDGRFDGFKFIR